MIIRPITRLSLIRQFSTRKSNDVLSQTVTTDMIGLPDPISNLRPVKYFVRSNESPEEKQWREMQQEADTFNQTFWTNNNVMFAEAKQAYEDKLIASGQEVTAEALSVFYKDFLDKAYDRQMAYNRAWWKRNVAMLYPGLKAALRDMKYHRLESSRHTGFWEKSFDS